MPHNVRSNFHTLFDFISARMQSHNVVVLTTFDMALPPHNITPCSSSRKCKMPALTFPSSRSRPYSRRPTRSRPVAPVSPEPAEHRPAAASSCLQSMWTLPLLSAGVGCWAEMAIALLCVCVVCLFAALVDGSTLLHSVCGFGWKGRIWLDTILEW